MRTFLDLFFKDDVFFMLLLSQTRLADIDSVECMDSMDSIESMESKELMESMKICGIHGSKGFHVFGQRLE